MSEASGTKSEESGWLAAAPRGLRPYLRLARLDRPIGIWLLLWPCVWSIALAGEGRPDIALLGLFALGSLVMRSAGCVINDMVDRRIDAEVARTRTRPLASGELSLARAFVFLALLLLTALAVLLSFNTLTIVLGALALPLVVAYPFMKRFTHWPQAFLGLTFNWGALLGFAALQGGLKPSALLLYAAGFFWTLAYDTIYAHQDKEDDALIGVKSSARRLGGKTKPALAFFFAAALGLFALAGALEGFSLIYFAALLPALLHFAWQWRSLDIDAPASCLAIFRSNREAGLLLLAALLIEAMLRSA